MFTTAHIYETLNSEFANFGNPHSSPAADIGGEMGLLESQTPIEVQQKKLQSLFEQFLLVDEKQDLNSKNFIFGNLKRNRKIKEEAINSFLSYYSFKILDEVNRNMILATKVINENLEEVEQLKSKNKGNFNDVISVELTNKLSKLDKFVDFVVRAGLAQNSRSSSESRSNIIEPYEMVVASLEIRKFQKKCHREKNIYGSQGKEMFSEALLEYLKQCEGGEPNQSYLKSIDYFYLHPKRSYKIFEYFFDFLYKNFPIDKETIKIEDFNLILLVAEMLDSLLENIQESRQKLLGRLNVYVVRRGWWLHEQNFLLKVLPSFFSYIYKLRERFEQSSSEENFELNQNSDFVTKYYRTLNRLAIVICVELNSYTKQATNQNIYKEFDQFLYYVMEVLFGLNSLKTAVKISQKIQKYEYIFQAFVFYEHDEINIASLVNLWGEAFLHAFIDFSVREIKKGCSKPRITFVFNELDEYRPQILEYVRKYHPQISWLVTAKEKGYEEASLELDSYIKGVKNGKEEIGAIGENNSKATVLLFGFSNLMKIASKNSQTLNNRIFEEGENIMNTSIINYSNAKINQDPFLEEKSDEQILKQTLRDITVPARERIKNGIEFVKSLTGVKGVSGVGPLLIEVVLFVLKIDVEQKEKVPEQTFFYEYFFSLKELIKIVGKIFFLK